jgi:RNA polymerase sigma-70 factor, ECF subfamily
MVEQCIRGNQLAQSMLFNKHYHRMYNLCMRILSDHHDVEDVLVVSFTRVFSNIRRFEYRGENSLEKWIKTIVINEAIRFCKANNRIRYDEELTGDQPDTAYNADLSGIDVDQVYSIIEAMPAGYRIVFNLFAIEGYAHKEISELLGITESTSKSQLRKARMHIIERLENTPHYGTQ